jgi:hypothetical protein
MPGTLAGAPVDLPPGRNQHPQCYSLVESHASRYATALTKIGDDALHTRLAVTLLLLVGVSAALFVSERTGNDAAAAGGFRIIVPNLASDSARAAPPPTPTPAPTSDSQRWVKIFITITAEELAVTSSGTLPVRIFATADAPLPGVLDTPTPVTGTFTISPHGTDSAGCVWTRTITQPNFTMTVGHSGDLSILASIVAPEWFYTMRCPGNPAAFRFPDFGEEGLFYFLQQVMSPYRVGNSVRLPTDVDSSGGCLKRSATFRSSSFNGEAQVDVYVYQKDWPGGCLLPLLP